MRERKHRPKCSGSVVFAGSWLKPGQFVNKEDRARGLGPTDPNGIEGRLKLPDAARNDDDVGSFGSELFGNTEAHSLGRAGQENGLRNIRYRPMGVVLRGPTLPSTGILFPPNNPIVAATNTVAIVGTRNQRSALSETAIKHQATSLAEERVVGGDIRFELGKLRNSNWSFVRSTRFANSQ